MKMDEGTRNMVQEHLGYTDEEMALFMENPRNMDVLAKAPVLMGKTIVATIVEASGCNSGHKVGDRFIFDGAGNLLTRLNPGRQPLRSIGLGQDRFHLGDNFQAAPQRHQFLGVGLASPDPVDQPLQVADLVQQPHEPATGDVVAMETLHGILPLRQLGDIQEGIPQPPLK